MDEERIVILFTTPKGEGIKRGEYARITITGNYGIVTPEGVTPISRLAAHILTTKIDYETSADEKEEDVYEDIETSVGNCASVRNFGKSVYYVSMSEMVTVEWPNFAYETTNGDCYTDFIETFEYEGSDRLPEFIQFDNKTTNAFKKFFYLMPHALD